MYTFRAPVFALFAHIFALLVFDFDRPGKYIIINP